ncbi:hypothetical protein AGMMS50233_10330 [Endomicrobiia bacterium]|nr:hypothetical protein AGMMS50233_10330 [Endomicrobiia bacterium]
MAMFHAQYPPTPADKQKLVDRLAEAKKQKTTWEEQDKTWAEQDKAWEEREKVREERDKAQEEREMAKRARAEIERENKAIERDKREEVREIERKREKEQIGREFKIETGKIVKAAKDGKREREKRAIEWEKNISEQEERHKQQLKRKKEVKERAKQQAKEETKGIKRPNLSKEEIEQKMAKAAEQRRGRKEQKDKLVSESVQESSPTSDAANEYTAENRAYASLKGLFGEDEVLKQTQEDERENIWAELLPVVVLDQKKIENMINRNGSIANYYDMSFPEGKQRRVDKCIEYKRRMERVEINKDKASTKERQER